MEEIKNIENKTDRKLAKPENESGQVLYWSGIVNYIAAFIIGISVVVLWQISTLNANTAYLLLLWTTIYISTGLAQVAIANKFPHLAKRYLYLFLVLNFLIISIIINLTGEAHGEFLFLYTIPITIAALVSVRLSIISIFITVGSYLTIEYIKSGLPFNPFSLKIASDEIQHVIIILLIGCLMTIQTRYYLSRIKKKDEELLRTKDEFLFRTVHDLRSPSSNIRLIAEKYKKLEMIEKYPEINEDLRNIHSLSINMLHLVKDLLEATQGDYNRDDYKNEELDALALLDKKIKEKEGVINIKKINVHSDEKKNSVLVVANSAHLEEVFDNLIVNAISYNKNGGDIWFENETVKKSLIIRVRNTVEQEISDKTISSFFTPFFRNPPRADIPGTGLGLYICKKLIEKMDGSIKSIKNIDKTITFEISLPLAKD